MKDDRLISLNAAIDALRDRYYKYDRFAKIEELVWAIEALPSAQLKLSCDGCKHLGMFENEIEYGYSCPCLRCIRRVDDNYEQ